MRSPFGSAVEHHWVVLIGPDGVGKTTIANLFLQKHGGKYTHFVPRAGFVRPNSDAGGARSIERPRSVVLSILVLVVRVIQAWLFYCFYIQPALRRGPVVSDRWVFGYVGDPAPLRHKASVPLTEFLIGLTPSPHRVVLLGGAAGAIANRKAELSREEIQGTLTRYRRLASWFHLSEIDTTTLKPEKVVEEIESRLCTKGVYAWAPPRLGAQWAVRADSRKALAIPYSTRARTVLRCWSWIGAGITAAKRYIAAWPEDIPGDWIEVLKGHKARWLARYLPESSSGRDRVSWFYEEADGPGLLQIKVQRGVGHTDRVGAEYKTLIQLAKLRSEEWIVPEALAKCGDAEKSLLLLRTPYCPSINRRLLQVRDLVWIVGQIQRIGEVQGAYFSHGDLTPWNAWVVGRIPLVLDWEESGYRKSCTYDVVQYLAALRYAHLPEIAPVRLLEWYSRSQIVEGCEEVRSRGPSGYEPFLKWIERSVG